MLISQYHFDGPAEADGFPEAHGPPKAHGFRGHCTSPSRRPWLQLQRYSTNTKRYALQKVFGKPEFVFSA